MAISTRIYFKKQIRVDHLRPQSYQLLKLANVGLASRKNEIEKAITPSGAAAKPLGRGYAIFKSRYTKRLHGRGSNKRDLKLSGQLMKGWLVRTVSSVTARASWSTLRNRQVALANEQKESFIAWSAKNIQDVGRAAVQLFGELTKGIIIEKNNPNP